MLLSQVSNEGVPIFLSWSPGHKVVEDRILVVGDFFIQVSKLKLRTRDVEAIEGDLDSTDPLVDLFGIKGGKLGFRMFCCC